MALNIRQERLKRRWTLAQAAEKVGITKAAYGNLETGTKKPSYAVLVKLLDLYDYNDPRELFGAATPAIGETPGSNRAAQEDSQD